VHLAADLLEGGERWLEPDSVAQLLDLYGIRSAKSRLVKTPEEVAAAAEEIGKTVVVKIDSRTILHKTDVGGVRLGLDTPAAASEAAAEMRAALEARGLGDELDGFLVQEMVRDEGAEMFVGMTLDPSFGPLLACGAGGTMVELLRDVSVRITPLTDRDATEMLRSLKTWPVFEGYRGHPALDAGAMEDLLLRISALVEDVPHLVELDLNPVQVLPKGCVVLDARMKIAAPSPPAPRGARTASR
jgi:acyl-CoA synthetase (NDP forming)